MFFLNRKEKAKDNGNKTIAKCKHCAMEFDDKERLSVHDKHILEGEKGRRKLNQISIERVREYTSFV